MGSVFYFTLPYQTELLSEKHVDKEVSHIDNTNPVNNLKILIVEDDEISEELISIILEKFGKEILRVESGISAVEACRSNPDIDLVLMDIQMPGMNGYEATIEIRKFNKNIIIIAQTAFALEGDENKATSAVFNDYISKPIIASELEQKVQSYFSSRN